MLQATDTLVLNCTGENNIDATQLLRINWLFTSFDIQNQRRLYNISDSEVAEMRRDDNITVISVLTINNVQPTNGGVYDCLVFNRDMVRPVIANATVIVFCKYYTNNASVTIMNCLSPEVSVMVVCISFSAFEYKAKQS